MEREGRNEKEWCHTTLSSTTSRCIVEHCVPSSLVLWLHIFKSFFKFSSLILATSLSFYLSFFPFFPFLPSSSFPPPSLSLHLRPSPPTLLSSPLPLPISNCPSPLSSPHFHTSRRMRRTARAEPRRRSQPRNLSSSWKSSHGRQIPILPRLVLNIEMFILNTEMILQHLSFF